MLRLKALDESTKGLRRARVFVASSTVDGVVSVDSSRIGPASDELVFLRMRPGGAGHIDADTRPLVLASRVGAIRYRSAASTEKRCDSPARREERLDSARADRSLGLESGGFPPA